jgi:hypothetical protein
MKGCFVIRSLFVIAVLGMVGGASCSYQYPVASSPWAKQIKPTAFSSRVVPVPVQDHGSLVVHVQFENPARSALANKTVGEITSYMTFTATGSNMPDTLTFTVTQAQWNSGPVNINFVDLLPGEATLSVAGADDKNKELFKGSATASILANQVTNTTITAIYNKNNIVVPFQPNQAVPLPYGSSTV